MEIDIGGYGRAMFEMMVGSRQANYELPEHWKSIKAKAEPLVRELIRLNDEMVGGGYKIVGYKDDKGKTHLPEHQRIHEAQKRLWGIPASKLKTTDMIWLLDLDHEMYIGQNNPCSIEYIKGSTVGVNVDVWGQDVVVKITKNDIVLRAPDDWEENEDLYSSAKYWTEQADKLGI